jgi:hypothetical protein
MNGSIPYTEVIKNQTLDRWIIGEELNEDNN